VSFDSRSWGVDDSWRRWEYIWNQHCPYSASTWWSKATLRIWWIYESLVWCEYLVSIWTSIRIRKTYMWKCLKLDIVILLGHQNHWARGWNLCRLCPVRLLMWRTWDFRMSLFRSKLQVEYERFSSAEPSTEEQCAAYGWYWHYDSILEGLS